MQTAFHIYALTHQMNASIIGGELVGTEFYKKEREAYILLKCRNELYALGMAYHPVGFGTFLIPKEKMEIETSEKPWPFFQEAEGAVIESASQHDFDRIIRIDMKRDSSYYSIIVEAIGPNGNMWLLDGENKIRASLRHRKYEQSEPYKFPAGLEKLNPSNLNPIRLKELFGGDRILPVGLAIKKCVAGFDDLLAKEVVYRAGIDEASRAGDLEDIALNRIVEVIPNIYKQFEEFDRGFVYSLPGGSFAYPFKMKSISAEPEKYKSFSLAVYKAIKSKKSDKIELSEKDRIINSIARAVQKLERKAQNIEQDISAADKFAELHKWAELLKINLSAVKKGMTEIKLEDKYGDGRLISIPLDPALGPLENAEEYFKKYRKAKESVELLRRRYEIALKEFGSIREMQEEFDRSYDAALEKYRSEIDALLPTVAKKKEVTPRLPYKAFTLRSGVTIFVGRDGTDNDTTTFHHARPYELWFHASQCPGSHVVMKFPDKNFKPSKAEITEAAAIAAYHSKARKSKAVAVIYTERKFVHKPRGAKPGLVTVEREKMVMVEPKKVD